MRYKYLVYFLLAYLPFYMPIRILYSEHIIYLQDVIVSLLFSIFIYKKTFEQNRIDAFIISFLGYTLILILFLSALKSGPLLVITHFHNFITGILMYFIGRNILNKKDFHVLLNLYIYTALIISVFYSYEWITVNIFNYPIFSWVTEYYNKYGAGEQFLDKGSLGFFRPMGFIGYSHATGIFISGGLAIVYSKMQLQKLKIYYILYFMVLLVAIILTGSRIAIGSTLIIFITGYRFNIKSLSKSILYLSGAGMALLYIFQQYTNFEELLLLKDFLFSSFSGSTNQSSIFEIFEEVFFRDIQEAKFIINDYPLALFTGAGFPFYNQGNIINPVLTNDTYFLMWVTQYGLFGCLLMLYCLIKVFKRLKQNLMFKFQVSYDRIIILSAYRILLIYLFSTIHSSSIQMYPIYFGFFIFLGISNYMTSSQVCRQENKFYQLT